MAMNNLASFALGFGVVVVVLAFVALITQNVQSAIENASSNTSTAYNIATQGLNALNNFGGWLVLIVLVGIASIILGLLVAFGSGGDRL